MFNFLKKAQWLVVDCVSGQTARVERFPFELGCGEGVDFKLEGDGVAERHCAVNQIKGQGLCLVKQDATFPLIVDGQSVEFQPLSPDYDYPVKIGAHFLVVRGGNNSGEWLRGLNLSQWYLHDSSANLVDGPMGFEEICQFARDNQRPGQALLIPAGLSRGFLLSDAWDLLSARKQASTGAEVPGEADEALMLGQPEKGKLTCPVCWQTFDLGDVMNVATHDSLRGDPVLGEDVQQRFLATRFNDRGQALDAMGLPSSEIACPHCRRVLPPGFTEMKHHIISMVGDQSAGKSYYLSVLLQKLPARLFADFSLVFQDSDPTGNAVINQMRQALFGAKSPKGARLVKTQLEGSMYERLPRYGRMVALPKPFVFSVAAAADPNRRCSLIFYDNAGEHFQPGRDSADSPGAQHVASASGILFLFDPFNNPEFRRRISDGADPQLENPVIDQQGIILSEMKVRIAKLLKLKLMDQIDTPLAMLIGKSDAWLHLLGKDPMLNPVMGGELDMDAVGRNSAKVRDLMKKICPSVVANAESISRKVLYFPVSSFGHPPIGLGPGDYAPDPAKLEPFMVEIPVILAALGNRAGACANLALNSFPKQAVKMPARLASVRDGRFTLRSICPGN